MGILPIILFLLGVCFLFLSWLWHNPPNEEVLTALKGLAYLKREIIRVQDQVQDLESKLLEFKEIDSQKVKLSKVEIMEKEVKEVKIDEPEFGQLKSLQKGNLYVINAKERREGSGEVEVKLYPQLSPKDQEVLELAANGQHIPEIAQRLFLSQDEVRMVLRLKPYGGNYS